MSQTHPPNPAEVETEAEIDLEPTGIWSIEDEIASSGQLAFSTDGDVERSAHVSLVRGSASNLGADAQSLLRKRLIGVAIFLSVVFGLLFLWVFLSDRPATLTASGSRFSFRAGFTALKCLLAAAVAGLLTSDIVLTRKQLRAVELVLFLGLTAAITASYYFVSLDLMGRGPEFSLPIMAITKNQVIQMMALMLIYGTLIPNTTRVAAPVIALMFLIAAGTGILLKANPEMAPVVALIHEAEDIGSNILFLLIGAVLAIYSVYLLNGLRAELIEAKRFGHYHLVKKLASGGMGDVFLAEHQLLKRPCALKLIQGDIDTNPVALARFEREVQSAARLSHPNVIGIYDYGHTDDGTFYYVMEFLPGLSLEDIVRQYGPLSPGRVIYLMRQVCRGLNEAHALGLIHRDLKPANIFVALRGGEYDVAKVLDFGLVKLTKDQDEAQLTGEQIVSGTPTYMSPEQAVGEREFDGRTDIYALGGVMYFALTGRPPFAEKNPTALMIAHARDQVEPPSKYRADIPKDLDEVILCCLEKKPSDRYPGIKALEYALASCESAGEWDARRAEGWWIEQAEKAVQTEQLAPVPAEV